MALELINFIDMSQLILEKGIVSKVFISELDESQTFKVDRKGVIQDLKVEDLNKKQFKNVFSYDELTILKTDIELMKDETLKYANYNLDELISELGNDNDLLSKEVSYKGDFSLLSKEDRIKFRGYRYGKKYEDFVYETHIISIISNSLDGKFKNKDKLATKIFSDLSNHSPSGIYETLQLLDTQVDLVNEVLNFVF